MLGSTIPVSIIGIRFAMDVQPFWKPEQYSAYVIHSLSAFAHLCGSSGRGYALRGDHLRHSRLRELRA